MTEKKQIYKCKSCGNIIEVLHEGAGELVCCGKPMMNLKENTVEAATEKHIPIIEKTGTGIKVTVGEVIHPMDEDHYIEFIELIADGRVYRKDFSPGDNPVAEFCISADNITARAQCNLHLLWKS